MKISWKQYIKDMERLKKIVEGKFYPEFDLIIGVERGGLIPATYLSYQLDVPMATIKCKSYFKKMKTEFYEVEINPKLISQVTAKRVLVVDDIIDTGETFKEIEKCLGRWAPAKLSLVVMYCKDEAYYVKHSSGFAVLVKKEWVTFPYDKEEGK